MKICVPVALAGSGLLAFASTTGAQTSSPSVNPQPEAGLEEIVVTARRRAETVEDVPQVVNAVTPETLSKYNIQEFQDIAAVVPGLTLRYDATDNGPTASLRGVDFNTASSASPTVQLYLNEAAVDSFFVFQSLFDLGPLEVLRGPQGTLRGSSAPSGAITVTTRGADLTAFGGYGAITGSDQNQAKAEGAVNAPLITDMLAIRVAGVVDDNHGNHVNSLNSDAEPHQHTSAERISLNFQPFDAFTLATMYQHSEVTTRSFLQVAGSGALGAATPGGCFVQGATGSTPIPCPAAGYNGPVITPEERLGVQNQPLDGQYSYDVATAQGEYRFGGQKVSYVGGYSQLKYLFPAYSDPANMLLGGQAETNDSDVQEHAMTHELRLASEERVLHLFDYTAGVFFSLEKPGVNLPWPASYLNGAFNQPGEPLGLPNPQYLDQRYLIHTDSTFAARREERSIFTSITWHIDDKTELTGGGRYIISTANETTASALQSDGIIAIPAYLPPQFGGLGLPFGTPCSVVPGAVGSTYPGSCDLPSSAIPGLKSGPVFNINTHNRWTPKVYNASLSRHFTDEILAYLSYGTAWRRGPTQAGIQNASNDPVLNALTFTRPETSKAWELGLKSSFLDNRGRANIAVYRQTYDGFIYTTPYVNYLADSGGGVVTTQQFQFTTNVPATVKGVDFDALLQLTTQWSAGIAASYADGKIDNAPIPCNAPIPAGQHVALCTSSGAISTAPPWNATLQSEYSIPLPASFNGYLRGLLTYYPKNDRASGADSGFTADQYALLNVFTGVRSSKGNWDVQLFARNVTNTRTTLTYGPTSLIDTVSPVNSNFGNSGYYRTSVTPLREFGITARYSFGSR